MIDLDAKSLKLVKEILIREIPNTEVRAFGSRVNGNAKPFSDLDLVIVSPNPLNWQQIENVKNQFSESDLPITVDVINWATISENFRKIIEKKYIVIQRQK